MVHLTITTLLIKKKKKKKKYIYIYIIHIKMKPYMASQNNYNCQPEEGGREIMHFNAINNKHNLLAACRTED